MQCSTCEGQSWNYLFNIHSEWKDIFFLLNVPFFSFLLKVRYYWVPVFQSVQSSMSLIKMTFSVKTVWSKKRKKLFDSFLKCSTFHKTNTIIFERYLFVSVTISLENQTQNTKIVLLLPFLTSFSVKLYKCTLICMYCTICVFFPWHF